MKRRGRVRSLFGAAPGDPRLWMRVSLARRHASLSPCAVAAYATNTTNTPRRAGTLEVGAGSESMPGTFARHRHRSVNRLATGYVGSLRTHPTSSFGQHARHDRSDVVGHARPSAVMSAKCLLNSGVSRTAPQRKSASIVLGATVLTAILRLSSPSPSRPSAPRGRSRSKTGLTGDSGSNARQPCCIAAKYEVSGVEASCVVNQ
jgi:hypothetical protein